MLVQETAPNRFKIAGLKTLNFVFTITGVNLLFRVKTIAKAADWLWKNKWYWIGGVIALRLLAQWIG